MELVHFELELFEIVIFCLQQIIDGGSGVGYEGGDGEFVIFREKPVVAEALGDLVDGLVLQSQDGGLALLFKRSRESRGCFNGVMAIDVLKSHGHKGCLSFETCGLPCRVYFLLPQTVGRFRFEGDLTTGDIVATIH